jgi:hypothetical protein
LIVVPRAAAHHPFVAGRPRRQGNPKPASK